MEASDAFYRKRKQEEGQGYTIVKRLLCNYRNNKWIRSNRSIRFPGPLGNNVSLVKKKVEGSRKEELIAQIQSTDNTVRELTISQLKEEIQKRGSVGSPDKAYGISLANIYYLTDIAEETDWATRALYEYLYSYRPGLESILTLMLEMTVESMQDSSSKKLSRYGRLIYYIYMDLNNVDRKIEDMIPELGYKERMTYYRHHDAAIELIGKRLFGLVPGEFGLADIIMQDGKYIFADPLLYNDISKKAEERDVEEKIDLEEKKFFADR